MKRNTIKVIHLKSAPCMICGQKIDLKKDRTRIRRYSYHETRKLPYFQVWLHKKCYDKAGLNHKHIIDAFNHFCAYGIVRCPKCKQYYKRNTGKKGLCRSCNYKSKGIFEKFGFSGKIREKAVVVRE